jgi:hypothetical protein
MHGTAEGERAKALQDENKPQVKACVPDNQDLNRKKL